jgi:CheY-like chemotaxis protein
MERSRDPKHARLSLRALALTPSDMALSTDCRRRAELTPWARLAPGAAGPSPTERPERCLPTPLYSLSRMTPGCERPWWRSCAPRAVGSSPPPRCRRRRKPSSGWLRGVFDVVLANIHLTADRQAREGYALWQRWTALNPHPSFILMSGDTSSRDLPAIRAGAVRWLTKPFSPAEVLEALWGALGR